MGCQVHILTTLSVLVSIVSAAIAPRDGLKQSYCSSQNTGSDYPVAYWTWQSNGWCSTHCQDSYAFAVVQGNDCWCSNYIPAKQLDVGDCSDQCPGYPEESCGSTSNSYFGYIALSIQPSGTAGAAASSIAASTASAPPSSSPTPEQTDDDPTTVYKTVTESASVVTSIITPTASEAPATTTIAPSSTPEASTTASSQDSPSPTWTPTPVTTVQVVTISGAVVTQTVTSMPTAPPRPLSQTSKKSVSTGAIAGAVVGSVAAVALVGGFLFWFFYRQRRNRNDEGGENGDKRSPQRNTSTMSRTGLLKSEKDPVYLPPIITARRSSHGLDNVDSISPVSERRHSKPLFYDQRLNPAALMEHENGSHTSFVSIADNRDYTRTLGVTNPDPRPSTDERGSSK